VRHGHGTRLTILIVAVVCLSIRIKPIAVRVRGRQIVSVTVATSQAEVAIIRLIFSVLIAITEAQCTGASKGGCRGRKPAANSPATEAAACERP